MRRFAEIVVLLVFFLSCAHAESPKGNAPTTYRDLPETARIRATNSCSLGWTLEFWAACAKDEDRQYFAKIVKAVCATLGLTLDPAIDSINSAKKAVDTRPDYIKQIFKQVSTLEAQCFLLGHDCGKAQLLAQIYHDEQPINDESRTILTRFLGDSIEIAVRIKLPDELLYRLTTIKIQAGETGTAEDFGRRVDEIMQWRIDACRELAGAVTLRRKP